MPLLGQFLSLLTATFIAPLALANQALPLPLPQDVSYKSLAFGQISAAQFTTDVTAGKGRVAAATNGGGTCGDGIDNDGNGSADCQDASCWLDPSNPASCNVAIEEGEIGAKLDVQLIRTPTCVLTGDYLTYEILIKNVGNRPAVRIVIQNQHPIMPITNVQRPTDEYIPAQRLMIWREPILAPGDSLRYTFQVPKILDRVRDDLTVEYFSLNADGSVKGPFQVKTYDFAKDPCHPPIEGQIVPDMSMSPLPTKAQPAIICDPAEASCVPSWPQISGSKFDKALPPDEAPPLGPRYQEALADIIPGECRVIPDDIIVTPEYQDALNRQASPAAFFLEPLYQSGQDFKRLVHTNVLLGITNAIKAKSELWQITDRNWRRQIQPLQQVLARKVTTATVRGLIPAWKQQWQAELEQKQLTLAASYKAMQEQRKAAFPPVAAQAVANAENSIARSCPKASDGGLEDLLLPVKDAYEQSLVERLAAYDPAQTAFRDAFFTQWPATLEQALTAFDQGNSTPLDDYIKSIPGVEQTTFASAWAATYRKQQSDDEKADNNIRINNFEIALDTPKSMATECAKEKLFNYHVATTWCESGSYPELLLRSAPMPNKATRDAISPPDTSKLDGTKTTIKPEAVTGQVCGKGPGDPWWASDCSCECGQIVPRDGADPTRGFVACEGVRSITRHDYFVTTQAECLNELASEPKPTAKNEPPF